MQADTIVGYIYRADIFTPKDLIDTLVKSGTRSPAAYGMSAEDVLDQWAIEIGLNRYEEFMFGSDEFPKVIFVGMIDDEDPEAEYLLS